MKRIIHILSLLLMTLSFLGCGNSEKKSGTSDENIGTPISNGQIIVTKAQFGSSAMELGSLTERPFPKMVRTTGMLDVPPQNRAVISAFSGGYIKDTPLLIGDIIKKGQGLVTLENPEFVQMQQEYLEMAEQLNYLKSEYDRQKTLIAEQITSQKNFLKAESEYRKTVAMYNGLHKKLQMLNIDPSSVEEGKITSIVSLYAPINGSVTKMNISKGMYVSPADEIMEIVNTDHIHLELDVFEKDVMKIKKDQPILFKIPEASPDTFEAEIYLVGTSIDVKKRTIKVHGHLNNDFVDNFAVGMYVEAQIVTDSTVSKALPEEAIISVEDRSYVLVNDSNEDNSYTFRKEEVMVGETYNGFTAIENSDRFKETDLFLVKGGFYLIGEE